MTGSTTGVPVGPTWTYTYNPLTNEVDEMRLLIGDTGNGNPSKDTCIFADQEILYFIDQGHGSEHLAAHHAFSAAASKYSQMADKTLGPMSIKYSEISENYRKQAIIEFENATNSADVTPQPYSFTAESGERDIESEQTNHKVPAEFFRGEYENHVDAYDAETNRVIPG
jgi:hypothetical protein